MSNADPHQSINLSCFNHFPVLKTKRLTLRQVNFSDAGRIFDMRANARTNQFIPRPEMESVESAKALLDAVENGYQNKNMIAWAGLLRDQKEIIGTCGFNGINHQNRRAEIGGELLVDYWGKNIALEAVETIIGYGFAGMNLHTIEAKVNPENRGAIALLNHFGFVREGYFKDYGFFQNRFQDLAVYTLFAH